MVEIPKNLNESLIEAWNEPEKLPKMQDWLKAERSESACSQYALIMLKKHFERENLTMFEVKTMPTYWSVFVWDLYANAKPLVDEGTQSSMLKSLFAELVEFCESAFPDYFVYHLKLMLEKFLEFYEENAKIELLLPKKALEQITRIRQMIHDDYEAKIERENQMGY